MKFEDSLGREFLFEDPIIELEQEPMYRQNTFVIQIDDDHEKDRSGIGKAVLVLRNLVTKQLTSAAANYFHLH